MNKNSRFAVAVHILTLLAVKGDRNISSDEIASSVNTNPVIIRRLLGMLRKAGLVVAQEGSSGGARLACSADEITLLDVYRAVQDQTLFPLHPRKPDPNCLVGGNITDVLQQVIGEAQAQMEKVLAGVSIADVRQSIVTLPEK